MAAAGGQTATHTRTNFEPAAPPERNSATADHHSFIHQKPVKHRCLMEITVRERSRTSSQAASSIGLIVVAILILAGPIISIALALFLDANDTCSSSGCSAATTPTHGQQCPTWYGYYVALVQGATVWFLYGVPRLVATLFTLHLAICAAYVGLIHLGIISDR